uniref:G_PROTEIN_RECEP_F1_2 domain-containing protein n=1 Tax=Globodera pallida TaxID=36090 RepID=A0A183C159_GLOPA
MEIFLDKNRFDSLYNCSFYNYDSVPRERRQNVIPGTFLLCLYIVFELLYLPCLWVFLRADDARRESCYRLMLLMAMLSMLSINSSCLIIGVYAIRGDVFCDRPNINFLIGMFCFATYCAESMVNFILALNRCVEMWNERICGQIFGRHRVYIWMLGALVYGAAMGFAFPPPIPNGMLVGWFWNPHLPFSDDENGNYQHILLPMHNFCIGFGLPLLYLIFYVLMRRKLRLISNSNNSSNDQQQRAGVDNRPNQMNVFLQVLLISMLNISFTYLYLYMQYFSVPNWAIIFASFAWACSQGFIPIIYITLNRSIAKGFKNIFVTEKIKKCNADGAARR